MTKRTLFAIARVRALEPKPRPPQRPVNTLLIFTKHGYIGKVEKQYQNRYFAIPDPDPNFRMFPNRYDNMGDAIEEVVRVMS